MREKRTAGLAMQPGDMVKLVILGDGFVCEETLMMFDVELTHEGLERVTRALRRAIHRNDMSKPLIRFWRRKELRNAEERELRIHQSRNRRQERAKVIREEENHDVGEYLEKRAEAWAAVQRREI